MLINLTLRFVLMAVGIVAFQVGRSVDETLRLVQAFQYTDHKGEGTYVYSAQLLYTVLCKYICIVFCAVCPAGWKPGEMAVSIVT